MKDELERATLGQRVYSRLRYGLLKGEFAAGEFIREEKLSERLAVSRTPVREALHRLSNEGFLEHVPRRGYRPPAEPVEHVLELYPIVAALEVLAGKLAFPSLADDDLDELREINARLRAAIKDGKVQRAVTLNNRFHSLVAARSGNTRLSQLLDRLRSQLGRLEDWFYSTPDRGRESLRQHKELIEALDEGDVGRAVDIFENNMQMTEEAYRKEVGVD